MKVMYLNQEDIDDLRQSMGKTGWMIAQRKAIEELRSGNASYEGALAEVSGIIIKSHMRKP